MAGGLAFVPALGKRRQSLERFIDLLPRAPAAVRRVTHLVLEANDRGSGEALVADSAGRDEPGSGELICIATRALEPLDQDWLARLAAPIGGEIVATTPVVVHPEHVRKARTRNDLAVRERGLRLGLDGHGEPYLAAVGAGSSPDGAGRELTLVDAASSCLLVDRSAFDDVGGLRPGVDPRARIADLALRLRSSGGVIVSVPESLVSDRTPVAAPVNLYRPLAPPQDGWRELVGWQGPSLRHAAAGRVQPRIAITTAAPPGLIARRWGDWELAHGLARSLSDRGMATRVQTRDQVDDVASRTSDVQLVVRGLRPVRRTAGQHHVVWVISHPEDLTAAELDEADLVLAASRRLAEHLRGVTSTPVDVLLQGTDHRRFRPTYRRASYTHPITVVANTRGVFRPSVAFAVQTGLQPTIYGDGWDEFVDRSLIRQRHVANDVVPAIYSSAGLVLNDHWPEMARWGMVSNRIYDVLACGTPIISDHLDEIENQFGDLVPMYRDADGLHGSVVDSQRNPGRARLRAVEGRRIVLAQHTLDRRARELIDLLRSHDLLPVGT